MKIALIGAECEESLALRYIRAALEQRGHAVTQIPFNAETETETAARALARSGAALAGFSMVFTYRAREFAALARRCREIGYRGHLVAGGHFAAFNARALLWEVPAFDSVAIGEGEELMCRLAAHLGALAQVQGLVWRDTAGAIHHNPPAEKPAELDRLAWPTRREPPDTILGLPIANMLASRGCAHSCAFCSIAAWHKLCGGPRLRLRSPAAVAGEMAGLYQRGYRIFNFHDDTFFLPDARQNLQRFWQLRGELHRRGVGRIAFAVKSRPDTVDEEVFAFLKEFGLFRVFLGIEAGTATALARLGRGQTLEDNERALEIVNRLKLHACFNLLMLNPDSTLEDFRAQVAFLIKHAVNPMNFCRTEIYAGTPLEARLRRDGRRLGDYWGYGYQIRDARAQKVFELIYRGLPGRNYGNGCLHHVTMRVDYERQILDHFWGCPASLRRRAKDFVRRVNLNSCDYLEEIAGAAAAGFAAGSAEASFVRQLSARIQHDNSRFTTEASRLLRETSQLAQPGKRQAGLWQQEAAAVLISSLTLMPAGLANSQTATAPPPPLLAAVADKDKAILQERLLPQIAALLPEYGRLRVRIVFDQAGHWRSGEVFNTTKGCFITIPPEIVQPLKIKELKGLTCEAIFTPAEVAAARAKAKPAPTPLKMATAEQRLRTELGPIFAHYLLADLRTPAEADVEIEVSANGRIASVKASAILPDPKAPTESNVKRDLINPKTMQMAMRYMRITDPTLLGKTWTIHYSSEELRKASADVHAKYKLMLIEPEPYTTEEAPEPPRGPPGTSIWDIPRRKF